MGKADTPGASSARARDGISIGDERALHIAHLMARGEYRTRLTCIELAEEWGISYSTAKGYAVDAARLLRQASETEELEVLRAACIGRLETYATGAASGEDPDYGTAVRAVEVAAKVGGLIRTESPLIRQRTADWFDSVAYTRREPRGTSFLINGTRWHRDDLSGRMIAKGWKSVNLQALDDTRGALWPRTREPVAKDATVFRAPFNYDAVPGGPYQLSCGIDFAYTANKYSDYNAAVLARICPKPGGGMRSIGTVQVGPSRKRRASISTPSPSSCST